MGKIITLTNQKGGVGKTTTCVNLGAYLADSGYSVLVVDMDPQGNATSGLGIKKAGSKSVYNIITKKSGIMDDGVIQPTMINNLYILPSNIDLAGAESELALIPDGREHLLNISLNKVKDKYDFVLIDSPPSLGLLTINAMAASDSVIIPVQCEFYALEGLTQLLNSMSLIKKMLEHSIEIEGVLLTMYDSRSKLNKQVECEIKKFFPNKIYKTNIPRNVRLAEAPSFGQPIIIYDKRCSGATAYCDLKNEFLKKNNLKKSLKK